MYFFILIILCFVLIPNKLEKNYPVIIYFKIFLISSIYFYLLNDQSILLFHRDIQ